MTFPAARAWLVYASLTGTGAALVFLILAPSLGYPLTFEQALRLVELLVPVFLGYLGSATQFLFRAHQHKDPPKAPPLLKVLVRGPVAVYAVATLSAFVAFGVSNGASALPGSGMSNDTLAGILTAALGILAVSTSVIVSYLFGTRHGTAQR